MEKIQNIDAALAAWLEIAVKYGWTFETTEKK